jgi:hypothetical protein
MKYPAELLAAIEGWRSLPHTELSVVCQAMYALATHDDSPQWIKDTAESIVKDLRIAARRTEAPR